MEKPSLDTAKAGAMRFNTDSSQLEIYDGNQWTGILATSPDTTNWWNSWCFSNLVKWRTMQASNGDTIYDFVNIATTGNLQLILVMLLHQTRSITWHATVASRTRGFVL